MKPRTKGPKTAARAPKATCHRLQLFVAGTEPNSQLARENLKRIIAAHLKDNCELAIVDVLKDFQTALAANVLVTPALVVDAAGTRTIIFGNLTETTKVLAALRLPANPP